MYPCSHKTIDGSSVLPASQLYSNTHVHRAAVHFMNAFFHCSARSSTFNVVLVWTARPSALPCDGLVSSQQEPLGGPSLGLLASKFSHMSLSFARTTFSLTGNQNFCLEQNSSRSMWDPTNDAVLCVDFVELDYAQPSATLVHPGTPTSPNGLLGDDSLTFLRPTVTLSPAINALGWDSAESPTDTLAPSSNSAFAQCQQRETHTFTAPSITPSTPIYEVPLSRSADLLFSWTRRSAELNAMYTPFNFTFPFKVIGQCIVCGSHRPPCNMCGSTHCPHAERTCLTCVGRPGRAAETGKCDTSVAARLERAD